MVALELQTAGRLSSISSTVTVHRFTARTAARHRLSHNPCLSPHGCGGPRMCGAAGPAQTGTPLFYHHTGLHDSLHLHWPVRLRLRSFLMSIKAPHRRAVSHQSFLKAGRCSGHLAILHLWPKLKLHHPSQRHLLVFPSFGGLLRYQVLPSWLLSGYCQAVVRLLRTLAALKMDDSLTLQG